MIDVAPTSDAPWWSFGDPVHPALVQVRWVLLVLQVVMAVSFLWTGDLDHRPLGLLATCAALGAIEVQRMLGVNPGPFLHAAIDLFALACLSFFWGPHHPLQALGWVELTIVATVLPATRAWTVAAFAIGLSVLDTSLQADGGADTIHLFSHGSMGVVAAIALTWFCQGIQASLRQREEDRVRAVAEKDRAARLAVVGTLAAGVAHELATPLGSITLLAEEAGFEANEAQQEALVAIDQQARRCRAILDRLLQRADGGLVVCDRFGERVEEWVSAWRTAHPDTDLTVEVARDLQTARVRGDHEVWRGALWTLLDNAERAGGPLTVRATGGEDVELAVMDLGEGPSEEAVRRAGEPFYSAWGTRGTGLGLYAVRTSLDGVGGRFALERRGERGGRAILWLPRVKEPAVEDLA